MVPFQAYFLFLWLGFHVMQLGWQNAFKVGVVIHVSAEHALDSLKGYCSVGARGSLLQVLGEWPDRSYRFDDSWGSTGVTCCSLVAMVAFCQRNQLRQATRHALERAYPQCDSKVPNVFNTYSLLNVCFCGDCLTQHLTSTFNTRHSMLQAISTGRSTMIFPYFPQSSGLIKWMWSRETFGSNYVHWAREHRTLGI